MSLSGANVLDSLHLGLGLKSTRGSITFKPNSTIKEASCVQANQPCITGCIQSFSELIKPPTLILIIIIVIIIEVRVLSSGSRRPWSVVAFSAA